MGNNDKLAEKEKQFLDDYFGKTQTMMFEHAGRLAENNNFPLHVIPDLVQTGYEFLASLLATSKEYAAFVNRAVHNHTKDSFKLIDTYVKNVMTTMAHSLKRDYANCASVEQDFPDTTGSLTFGQHLVRDILSQELGDRVYEDIDQSLTRDVLHSMAQLMQYELIRGTRQVGLDTEVVDNKPLDRVTRREVKRESQIRYSSFHGKRPHETSTNGDTQLKRYAKECGITPRWASRIAEYAQKHQLSFADSLVLIQQISSQPVFEQQFRAMYRQERAR